MCSDGSPGGASAPEPDQDLTQPLRRQASRRIPASRQRGQPAQYTMPSREEQKKRQQQYHEEQKRSSKYLHGEAEKAAEAGLRLRLWA